MNTEGLYVIKTIIGDEEAERFLNMMTEQGYFLPQSIELKRVKDVNHHTFYMRENPLLGLISPDTMSKAEAEAKLGISLDDPIPHEFKG